jgi:hypothetical protein
VLKRDRELKMIHAAMKQLLYPGEVQTSKTKKEGVWWQQESSDEGEEAESLSLGEDGN